MSGNGTVDNPWDLATALSSAMIRPGDTLLLRGGVYSGNFTCSLRGTAARRITIKSYPGEVAKIAGTLVINGDYVDWIGTENYVPSFTDREEESQEGPTVVSVPSGQSNRVINCVIHDGYQGFTSGTSAINTVFYGNVVYFCGKTNGLGHGTYPQNETGTKVIENNIFFYQFGFNIHCYGGGGLLNNFVIRGNTCFDSDILQGGLWADNILIGGAAGVQNPVIDSNYTWYRNSGGYGQNRVGYGVGNTVTNAIITDNVFCGGVGSPQQTVALRLVDCVPTTMTGNQMYGATDGFTQSDYESNTYGAFDEFPDAVYLVPNSHNSDRASVTVYNPSTANTVEVDVSSLFANGDTITARNVQDYWNDMQNLTVSGGNITVNMQASGRTVATPQGWTAPASTFPAFGAFVLERQ